MFSQIRSKILKQIFHFVLDMKIRNMFLIFICNALPPAINSKFVCFENE